MPFDANIPPTTEIDETTTLLIRARGFLERGWCRWMQAHDNIGISTEPTSKRAVAWCAFGALFAAGVPDSDLHPAVRRLAAAIDGENICQFNNRQETVEPVLAAFNRAITMGRDG